MLRANIKLQKDSLSFKWGNNTLIVSYKKPEVLLAREIEMRKEFEKLNAKKPKEGDIECTTQWFIDMIWWDRGWFIYWIGDMRYYGIIWFYSLAYERFN